MPETVAQSLAIEFPQVWNAIKNLTIGQLARLNYLVAILENQRIEEHRA